MVKKGIRGGIHNAIHQYVKAKNKYMNNYDKNKESSYLIYEDVSRMDNVTKTACKWFSEG